MNDDPEKPPPEPTSADEGESIDSLLRAVAHESRISPAHLTTVEMPGIEALEPPPLPRVGELIGKRFRVEALLGAGGMGAVFAARHVKTSKEVAIKVLLPRHGQGRFSHERVARFVREAQAAGRIRHPNVVDVYDVEEGDGAPYLVMERLHGESLAQRLKRELPSTEQAIAILLGAMRGVAEAHRQGVIHRDLKPDNIFLAGSPGGEVVPKVLDFGVSRIVAREDSNDPHPTTITRTGYVLGTPAYMPLEQLSGERDLDARADVYALAVILYETLSGQRPYEANNDHELVVRMVTGAPTPLRKRRADLDASLEALIMRGLARKAEQRYPDVDTFAAALSAWLRGERTESEEVAPAQAETTDEIAPPSKPQDAAAAGAMRLGRWGVVAFVLLLLALGVAFALRKEAPVALPSPKVQVAAPRHESVALPAAPVSAPPAPVLPPTPAQPEPGPAARGEAVRHKRNNLPRPSTPPVSESLPPATHDDPSSVRLEDF